MNFNQLMFIVLRECPNQWLHFFNRDIATLIPAFLREPLPAEKDNPFAKFFRYKPEASPLHQAIAINDFATAQKEAEIFYNKTTEAKQKEICAQVNAFHTESTDPSYQYSAGVGSPVHFAAFLGSTRMLAMLLFYRDPVHSLVDISPLFVACYAGHIDCVELLLRKPDGCIDVNTLTHGLIGYQNYSEYTALSVAAMRGHVDIVHLLCEYDAFLARHFKLADGIVDCVSRQKNIIAAHPFVVSLQNNCTGSLFILLMHCYRQRDLQQHQTLIKDHLDPTLQEKFSRILKMAPAFLDGLNIRELLNVQLPGLQERVKQIKNDVAAEVAIFNDNSLDYYCHI